jgi:hypothetical protein
MAPFFVGCLQLDTRQRLSSLDVLLERYTAKKKNSGRHAIFRPTMLFQRRAYSGRYSEWYTAKTLFTLYYIEALRKDFPYFRVKRGAAVHLLGGARNRIIGAHKMTCSGAKKIPENEERGKEGA